MPARSVVPLQSRLQSPSQSPPESPASPPAPAGRRRERVGDWFADDRGVERRLRVSMHAEQGLFVLSIWDGDTCTTTFRLPLTEVPRLVATFVEGLGAAAAHAARGAPSGTGPRDFGSARLDWASLQEVVGGMAGAARRLVRRIGAGIEGRGEQGRIGR